MVAEPLYLGSDPEYFVVADEGQTLIPAEYVSPPQDRRAALPFYYDNVAVEFEISPTHSLDQIVRRFSEVFSSFTAHVVDGVKLLATAAVDFPLEVLQETKHGRAFGCAPAMVITGGVSKRYKISLPDNFRKRSTRFHIHIGDRNVMLDAIPHHIMNADVLAGLFSVLADRSNVDANLCRRKEIGYGVAGEYRIQPHGYEYRTLPSSMSVSPDLVRASFMLVRDAYIAATNGLNFGEHLPMAEVARAINNMEVTKAQELLAQALAIAKNSTAVPNNAQLESSLFITEDAFSQSVQDFVFGSNEVFDTSKVTPYANMLR